MCLHVKGVDLFISRNGSESYQLHVYVEDNYTCTIAHGFTYEAIVEFINFNISDLSETYGDFDVVIDPQCFV